MNDEIKAYNDLQTATDKVICDALAAVISGILTEAQCKIWHAHPVWFINGNPTVGYSKQKNGIRLMFWSGADFDDVKLSIKGRKFKDASVFYNNVAEIDLQTLEIWLQKSREIQWDYKNLIKRKGVLVRIK